MTNMVLEIGKREFIRITTHPVVLVLGLLVLIIAFLNGIGGAYDLRESSNHSPGQEMVLLSFGHVWGALTTVCTVMAAFLGAMSIPYERRNYSVNILLTKPLFRRDLFLGKFLGVAGFMLVFNTMSLLLVGFFTIVYFQGPQSEIDFIERIVLYIGILTLISSLIVALNMLFGVISKNTLVVATASIAYIYFDRIWYNEQILGNFSIITPINLYNKLVNAVQVNGPSALYNSFVGIGEWFGAAFPILILLVFEIAVLLLAGIFWYSRGDDI